VDQSTSERPVAWLSLDEEGNDPARLWTYFIAVLQTIHRGVGEAALVVLQSPQPPSIELLLTDLVNEIAEIPGSFALILDDYHLITARLIHDGLTFLLDHMPPQMHLIIAAHADSPLPLALLRGRGQITEQRQSDLRFTTDEAAAFLNQIMSLNLSPDDIAALEARTEGGVAGLQMVALSMRGRKDVSTFIQAFTGSDRHILDYLVEEVLQRQPESV
jgi:LuxR family maltose regulon positive regulatory protein